MKEVTKKQRLITRVLGPLLISTLISISVLVLGLMGLGAEILTWTGDITPGSNIGEMANNGAKGMALMKSIALWILFWGALGSVIEGGMLASSRFFSALKKT